MGKKVTSYTNLSSLVRRIEIFLSNTLIPNSIGCFKSLENLLSAKPILRWCEVPAQETKDSDSAKDDACLGNKESDEQGYQQKKR